MKIAPMRNGAFAVTLKTNRPALWAWLELDGHDAALSDNFVHLRPGRAERIVVTPSRPMSIVKLRKSLRLRSLVNTYA